MNESLRPWLNLGLLHVLGRAPCRFEAAVLAQEEDPSFQPVRNPSPTSPSTPCPSLADDREKAVPCPVPEQDTFSQPPPAAAAISNMKHPGWTRLAASIQRRSFVVWTYWELGQDLLGKASGVRRSFLKQLIQAMRLPKGNIAFWPLALPLDAGFELDLEWFWRGVSRYSAEQVCCFGDDARQHLASQDGARFQNTFSPTLTVHYFPSVETLAAMPGQEFMEHLLLLMQIHQAL